jgi:exopolysaccharide biosynthesis WecB/TagA/CpsF family protein
MTHPVGQLVDIGGVNVLAADVVEFVARFDESLASGRPLKVAFLNANLFNFTRSDPALTGMLRDFTVLNDGVGLNLASLMLRGALFPANMNGTDLIPVVLSKTTHRLRIYLLGSRPSSVHRASEAIARAWPQHKVVGFQDGYYDTAEEEKIVERIRSSNPDLVLVGLGNPKQELWIAKHIPYVCPRAFAVGGLFDFVSGEVPRAPAVLRAMSMEWLFRLLYEPVRLWRRYLLGIPVFIATVTGEALGRASRWGKRTWL